MLGSDSVQKNLNYKVFTTVLLSTVFTVVFTNAALVEVRSDHAHLVLNVCAGEEAA